MDNLSKPLEDLENRLSQIEGSLALSEKEKQESLLRQEMAMPDFWQDTKRAARISQEAESLASEISSWRGLKEKIKQLKDLLEIEGESGAELFAGDFQSLKAEYESLEAKALLDGEYDKASAILSIHSGTGGVDAQDWALMLERMYLRFAERTAWKAEILDEISANEAGIKSAVLQISGRFAYGYLKGENGSHRLLRNSPFNADGLRQTSYALVEVIPEIEDSAIQIKEEDLRIDVFRSSGPGGQSVNTTDSAVRIVHLPTGITISCQSERSQKQNKENALKILSAKLSQLAAEAKEAEEQRLKGGKQQAAWSSQIRSYCLYGNRYVKDHRTSHESSAVEDVLDGNLEDFSEAYLHWLHASND